MKTKGIYNENRIKIFNFIIEHPGTHFSGIMRSLKMTKRGLGYHLEKMVKEGILASVPHGIFRYYYPAGADIPPHLTPKQQEILDVIREKPRTVEEIAGVLDKTAKSIEYHVQNLAGMEMIETNDQGHLSVKK